MPSTAAKLTCSPWVGGQHDWEKVLRFGVKRHLRPGDLLYAQGWIVEYFYYLNKGSVRVSICSREGSEKILAIQEPGSLIGETAAFDGQPCFSTAVAIEESEVYAFSSRQFIHVIREEPEIAIRIIQSLGSKMRVLAAQVSSLTFMDARSRIVYLLCQAADTGSTGCRIINMTHQDLANLTGLCRVTVTKVLNDLHRIGAIDKSRSRIRVRDPVRLRHHLVNPA